VASHSRSDRFATGFADLLRIWQIDERVLEQLRACRPVTEAVLARLDGEVYRGLFAEEPIRLLMRDEAVRERAVAAMTDHLRQLLSGDLRHEAMLRAALIGRRHQELGIDEQYLLALSQRIIRLLIDAVIEARLPAAAEKIDAIVRMLRFSNAISIEAQMEAQSTTATAQATSALRADVTALEALVYRDALTGLFNRRHFDQSLAAATAHALRHGTPLCLMLADIDRFKRVNDRHGHLAGDRVLRALAARMSEVVRANDVLARFGGEEFAAILPATTLPQAVQCAERLRVAAEALTVVSGERDRIRFTISLGVAHFQDEESSESLIRAADAALYAAKREGRNRVAVRPEPATAGAGG